METHSSERFALVLDELDGELDWSLLEREYCDGDAAGFFSDEAREAMFEAGLALCGDLGEVLDRTGRSLYVGAAVGELVPILAECLVLKREVHWHNLPCGEVRELDRALAAVAERLSVPLPRIDTSGVAGVERGGYDHVWLVSVLTDPDHFPALHDLLYERSGEEATGRGDVDEERPRAERLIGEALDGLKRPGVLTTTDEELELAAPLLRARGWTLGVPDVARLSPVVGDPVRVCLVR